MLKGVALIQLRISRLYCVFSLFQIWGPSLPWTIIVFKYCDASLIVYIRPLSWLHLCQIKKTQVTQVHYPPEKQMFQMTHVQFASYLIWLQQES